MPHVEAIQTLVQFLFSHFGNYFWQTVYKFNDSFAVGFRGDIGGFGIESDLTWEAFVGFGWHLSPHTSLTFGYRALGTDYSGDDFATDTISHGPIIGMVCKF